MSDPLLLRRLSEIGMTNWEAKLYMAMLERPEATAAELHRISGVLRTKVYEWLEQMVKRGYCLERVEGKRRYYRAVRPKLVEQSFKQYWENKLNIGSHTFSALEDLYKQQLHVDRSLDAIQVIRSKDQIHQTYLTLIEESQSEYFSFTRSPFSFIEDPKMLQRQEDALISKIQSPGYVARSLYMIEPDTKSWICDHIEKTSITGEICRVAENLPVKMYIFDSKKVLLALPTVPGQSVSDFTMIIIEDPGFAANSLVSFEAIWEKSLSYSEWSEKNN
jgi:HTH-type transcriptional regulator, sugar sensing transcriptional regulator